MNAPDAESVGGTGASLLVRELADEGSAPDRTPAVERLEQSLGGPMTERLLCALAGDHGRRGRVLAGEQAAL